MALPFTIVVSLTLASSSIAVLNMSSSGAEAGPLLQEVDVECTTVSLEYLSGGKSKKKHSENCDNRKNDDELKGRQKRKNVYNSEIDKK